MLTTPAPPRRGQGRCSYRLVPAIFGLAALYRFSGDIRLVGGDYFMPSTSLAFSLFGSICKSLFQYMSELALSSFCK